MIAIIDDRETPEQRQERIAQHAAVRARLAEIERELFAPASTHILSPHARQLNLAHEKHFAALRRERESLLAQLPPTGEAAGHLVMAHGLRGTAIVREVPPDLPRDDGYDASDPYQRYAREMGWSID